MKMTSTLNLLFYAFPLSIMMGNCKKADRRDTVTRQATYYIDATNGNDGANGLSATTAWKTLSKIQQATLYPGDSVRFKRGSSYVGPLYINQSGTEAKYIVVTDYGDPASPAPAFTNPVFKQGNFGNCIRIKGSAVIVENLYFHNTAAYVRGDYTPSGGWDVTVWEMGAVYIDKTASNCIVRNNEFNDCVVGIKSYGRHALIENNYLHDCNRVLKEWGWGPIGIWFGADYQEARYNRIFNYKAVDSRIQWGGGSGGGADGGAFEIDDARFPKSNISIHHNYTRDNQGFLEVTWTDIQQHPVYTAFRVHHNVSDDYQQFIALWNGAGCYFENNTIIRRKKNVNDWGVFNITQTNSKNYIRNNIIVVEQDIPIFNTGLQNPRTPNNIISNNLYFAASGNLVMSNEGPGAQPVFADPLFSNYLSANTAVDFSVKAGSPAVNKGMVTGYTLDFLKTIVPKGVSTDIGAFEIQ
jgi:hypothetical protein